MSLADKVKGTIDGYAMLAENDHVLIGLSGGADSVCLAVVLHNLRKQFNLMLSALYVDHGLRPDETEDEITFCRNVCSLFQIAFYLKQVDVRDYSTDKSLNIQEAARELRYEAYEEIKRSSGADLIALGHTADDQAETLMMRIIRGSGRAGLAGIPPVRGSIIRPLIETERIMIEEYLSQNDHEIPLHNEMPYLIDSSNLKDHYFRNWLRNTIMKEIKEKNPAVIEDIRRTADILREEDKYLEIIVTKTLMRLISRKSNRSIELFINPLEGLEKPIVRRVLRRALKETESLRGISFVHIEEIIELIKRGTAGDSLNLPRDVRVIKDYAILKITTEKPVRITEYELYPDKELHIRETGFTIKAVSEEKEAEPGDGKYSVVLSRKNMQFPLTVRSRNNGDFFYPLGFGKKKKLQDYFVDEKISRDRRDAVPIVLSGNDIIWVAGYRADDRYKVTDRTASLIRLEMSKTKPE